MEFSHLDSYTLLENLQLGVVVHDNTTKIRYANPKALALLRLTEDQVLGKTAFNPQWRFIDKDKRIMPVSEYPANQVIASKQSLSNLEVGICDSTSEDITWVMCHAYPEFSADHQLSQVIITFIDITAQKKAISFESIVELTDDIIVVTDANQTANNEPKIVYVNPAFTKYTGYSKAESLGKTPGILQGEKVHGETSSAIEAALKTKASVNTQILNYTRSGKPCWLDMNIFPLKNADDDITHFVAIQRDITDQKDYENKLKELSIRDPLTKLLNRRGFFELANASFDQSQRTDNNLVVAMIDIDHFKSINDNYGHYVGDQALEHLSTLMKNFFRKSDIIARMGGEEFAILMLNSEIDSTIGKMNTFLSYLAENPFKVNSEQTLSFTISVGLANYKESMKVFSDILKSADYSLYTAKRNGRNCIYVDGRGLVT